MQEASRILYRVQRQSAPYLFVAPAVIFYLIVTVIPMVMGFWMSLHRWNIIGRRQIWLGLGNYVALFHDPSFWRSLYNSLVYAAGVVPAELVGGLLVAVLLNSGLRLRTFYRLIYYLPVITPVAVAAVIWRWIYDPYYGIFTWAVRTVGLGPRDWLNDTRTAMTAVMIVAVWGGIGFRMVVFLAALQGIPSTFYEAARIDGADTWQLFRAITLPLLKPAVLFVLITSFISSLQVFPLINILTGGGPLDATRVVVYDIFDRAFGDMRFGAAAAMSFMLFAVIMIISLLQWRFLGRDVTYE
ncbi:MAG: sugar ABC transporter permease [Bacillota bacterium]